MPRTEEVRGHLIGGLALGCRLNLGVEVESSRASEWRKRDWAVRMSTPSRTRAVALARRRSWKRVPSHPARAHGG
jgi:hypothetical protein